MQEEDNRRYFYLLAGVAVKNRSFMPVQSGASHHCPYQGNLYRTKDLDQANPLATILPLL